MNKKAWGALAVILLIFIAGLVTTFYLTHRSAPPPSTPPSVTSEQSQEQKPSTELPSTEPIVAPPSTDEPASTPTSPTPLVTSPDVISPQSAEAPKPTLIFYVEKNLLPAKWIQTWEEQAGAKIDQRLLPDFGAALLPTDGDLYAFSPRFFGALQEKMQFLKLENHPKTESSEIDKEKNKEPDSFRKGVDPAFYGHSFDLDNEYTRPWRWTPYLFFLRQLQTSSSRAPYLPTQWWHQSSALFPEDTDLLIAMRLKDRPISIHTPDQRSMWPQISAEMEQALLNKTASDIVAWERLKKGEVTFALLPASIRLQAPREALEGLTWLTPTKGTIIQFDLLAISEKSRQTKLALSLLEYLQTEAQQKKLLDDTGYFPVMGSVKEQLKNSPIALPAGNWFNRSEYLMYYQDSSKQEEPPSGSTTSTPSSSEPTGVSANFPAATPTSHLSPSTNNSPTPESTQLALPVEPVAP